MAEERKPKILDHTGSSFDSFLDEQGIRKQVEIEAGKRVREWREKSIGRDGSVDD